MLKRELTRVIFGMLYKVMLAEMGKWDGIWNYKELAERDADILEVMRRKRPDLLELIPRVRRVSRFLDWEFIENELIRAFEQARFRDEFSRYSGIDLSGLPNLNLSQKERRWIIKQVRNIIRMVK